ncbi:MAG: hypothetical protein ABJZ55_02110 [Fuerstiella sp.]
MGSVNGCLGCVSEPTSFRLDFPEITYKDASLTASDNWDNGIAVCTTGHRALAASREFPDISGFGNSTILTREDVAFSACTWGATEAEVWGERRDSIVAGVRCDCPDAVSTRYGGTTLGGNYRDWDAVGTAVNNAQVAARPSDCGLSSVCNFSQFTTVTCGDLDARLGIRAILGGVVGGVWNLAFQWRQLGSIQWRLTDTGAFADVQNIMLNGNFASEDFTAFSGADITSAYSEVFQTLWPDCSFSNKSTSDMQWNYQKAFSCDDLDGSPFTLTLQDQAATNQRFANNYVNNPPATITLVAL